MSESKGSSVAVNEKGVGEPVVQISPDIPVSEVPKPPPGPTFPEGGAQAWLTVAGAALVQFCTFGYTNSFAVYQDFYERHYLTKFTSSQISWIGSVQLLLVLSTGFISGAAFDRGYFYFLIAGGTILLAFCLFMLSLAKPEQYYQIFLAQGLGAGLAMGMTYIPSLSIVSHYFSRRRPIAMGLVAAGSSLGATLHPIMLNNLFNNPKVGFATGVRASAGLILGLLVIAFAMMRTRLPPKKAVGFLGIWSSATRFSRDWAYVCAVCGGVLSTSGFYFPIFYLQFHAITHGLNTTFAFYTVTILNGVSVIGRIVPTFVAARFGVINMLAASMYSCAILVFGWLGVKNVGGEVAFSVVFGLFGGSLVTLLAPVYSSLARDVSEIGARMGIAFTLLGLGGLAGPPIEGALLGSSNPTWWKPSIYAGVAMACGGTFMATSRTIVARRKGKHAV
ncbi:hypothetical protein QCA50_002731 [Cerrena zonata]|uniref:MFS general substrate transporter n=1 Tax=Cerrena zonata TaxID=2478898 RepID=A0AAW0GIP2_9APHY